MTSEPTEAASPSHGTPEAAEDARLLAAYAAGDLGAARTLTARLGPRALGQAVRMLGDRAEAEGLGVPVVGEIPRKSRTWRTR